MRIIKVIHKLAVTFSEMDESEAESIYADATQDYEKYTKSIIAKKAANAARLQAIADNHIKPVDGWKAPIEEKLTQKEKLIELMEKWYMRYFNAFLYIGAVPALRNYMNDTGMGEEGEDDLEETLRLVSAVRKMKRV